MRLISKGVHDMIDWLALYLHLVMVHIQCLYPITPYSRSHLLSDDIIVNLISYVDSFIRVMNL